jgi:lipoate-protein ligase B
MVGACAMQAWLWQQQLVAQARERAGDPAESCDDTLLLLQHSPVYTLGDTLSASLQKQHVD